MSFDYAATIKVRDSYIAQAIRFEAEAEKYRERAQKALPDDKHSLLEAAKTLNFQASEVRQMADNMQEQIVAARASADALTFEEKLADARERGKKRGRGDEGLEI